MVLTFFSPLVFRVAGFGSNAALMGAVILAGVKFASLILSTLVIDRYGRKVLVIAGAALMIVCQVSTRTYHTMHAKYVTFVASVV